MFRTVFTDISKMKAKNESCAIQSFRRPCVLLLFFYSDPANATAFYPPNSLFVYLKRKFNRTKKRIGPQSLDKVILDIIVFYARQCVKNKLRKSFYDDIRLRFSSKEIARIGSTLTFFLS